MILYPPFSTPNICVQYQRINSVYLIPLYICKLVVCIYNNVKSYMLIKTCVYNPSLSLHCVTLVFKLLLFYFFVLGTVFSASDVILSFLINWRGSVSCVHKLVKLWYGGQKYHDSRVYYLPNSLLFYGCS